MNTTPGQSLGPAELAGIALYSEDLEEIKSAISQSVSTSNVDLFCVCTESIGHLARRFNYLDRQNVDILLVRAGKFAQVRDIHDAIFGMYNDLEVFLGKQPANRPQKYSKPFSF
jgi:hypothetical protein